MKPQQVMVAVLVPLAVFAAGCSSMRPRVESVSAKIVGIDLRGVVLAFDVGVTNPMPLPIKGPSGSYAIDIAGGEFVGSDEVPPLDLPAAGTGTVTLPARVEYKRLWRTYKSLGDAAETAYALRGTLRCPVAGQSFELPFAHEGMLPILRAPKFSVRDVRTSDVSIRSAKLEVVAEIRNPNVFEIGVRQLGYKLKLGDTDVGEATVTTVDTIASGGSGEITLTCEVRAAGVLLELARGTSVSAVRLAATGQLGTPYGTIDMENR